MAKLGAVPSAEAIRLLVNDKGLLQVHVTPNARYTEVRLPDEGDPSILRVRTTATPEDSKANDAVIALLAKALGVAKSKVAIERGVTARVKLLRLDYT